MDFFLYSKWYVCLFCLGQAVDHLRVPGEVDLGVIFVAWNWRIPFCGPAHSRRIPRPRFEAIGPIGHMIWEKLRAPSVFHFGCILDAFPLILMDLGKTEGTLSISFWMHFGCFSFDFNGFGKN